jgi:uncharacterized membrane protein
MLTMRSKSALLICSVVVSAVICPGIARISSEEICAAALRLQVACRRSSLAMSPGQRGDGLSEGPAATFEVIGWA